jgi:uncharacterized protein YodC (DUF2158 family)
MAGKWKTGDVVRLKSGGLPMTVAGPAGVVDPDAVACVWQVGSAEQRHRYHEDMLEAADTDGAMMTSRDPVFGRGGY